MNVQSEAFKSQRLQLRDQSRVSYKGMKAQTQAFVAQCDNLFSRNYKKAMRRTDVKQ